MGMMKIHPARLLTVPLLAASLALAGCSLFDGLDSKKGADDPDRFGFLEDKPGDSFGKTESIAEEQVNAKQDVKDPDAVEKIKSVPETQILPPKEEAKQPLHFYDDFVILNGDEEMTVSLVFNSAPLLDVLGAFADILGFNFLADSDLKSVVTLNIDQKMTKRELWDTFDKMLNMAGAGVTVEGTLLRIMALPKIAQQSDSRLASDGSGELFYYALKNTTAKDAISQIKPFVGPNAVCVELTRPNAVLIGDDRANMPKIRQLLDVIDKSGKSAWKRKVIKCSNILPSKLTEELQTVLPVLGFNVVQTTDKTELPGSIQMTGIDRLQLIIVSAATNEAIREIEQWIELLDSSDSLDQERVFVYKVKHNKSSQLVKALEVLYEAQGASLTVDSDGNQKIEQISSNYSTNSNKTLNANNQNLRTNTATSNSTATNTDRTSSVFNTPVRIFADGTLNRLVIRTTPRTYASIKALLDRLDVVPAQVLLQILVVEVTLSESTQFGIEFSGKGTDPNGNSLFGTNYSDLSLPTEGVSTVTEALSNIKTANPNRQRGFTYALTNPNNPEEKFGYIRALAGNGNIKVISNPQLLVTSHSEARIEVGSDISVRTQSVANTSSSDTNVTSNYSYKTTGVILTVTPQITSNDFIALNIEQELSSANYTTTTSENPNPSIDNRKVTTAMTISNGKTMVMGGLIQEKKSDSLDSIPIINQIPIINRLLGSTDAAVERTEILLLVTGTIITERNKTEELISRYNDAVDAINEFEAKLGGKEGKFLSRPRIMLSKEFWSNGLF